MSQLSLPAVPPTGAGAATVAPSATPTGPEGAFTALLAAALVELPVTPDAALAGTGAPVDAAVDELDGAAQLLLDGTAADADAEVVELLAGAVAVAVTDVAEVATGDGVEAPAQPTPADVAVGADAPDLPTLEVELAASRPGTAELTRSAAPAAAATEGAAVAGVVGPAADDTARLEHAATAAATPDTATTVGDDTIAPPTSPTAPAAAAAPVDGPEPGSAVARMMSRVLDALDVLENAPPPRRLTVDLPDVDGLRLHVALRGTEVSVTVLAGGGSDVPGWGRDLTTALTARGFSLGSFEAGSGERRQPRAPEDRPDEASPPAGGRPRRSTTDEGLRL